MKLALLIGNYAERRGGAETLQHMSETLQQICQTQSEKHVRKGQKRSEKVRKGQKNKKTKKTKHRTLLA
jgi:hypothetical protein